MTASIQELIIVMEAVAPPNLAEKWDNIGLQIGKRDWPVHKVLTALDPSDEVIDDAIRRNSDLLITHHPLLFQPVRAIDLDTPTGAIVAKALENRVAIYAAHTNLDSVSDGCNDILARVIGLQDIFALVPTAEDISDRSKGDSIRNQGLGRVGVLSETVTLRQLAGHLKTKLSLSHVTIAGDAEMPISKVAVCTGSGSGLMAAYYASGAQVYVSGDLRYHDARTCESKGLGLIDVGHFASEHLMVAALSFRLQEACNARGIQVAVDACQIEKNPFVIL